MKKLTAILLIFTILLTGASACFVSADNAPNIIKTGDFYIKTNVNFTPEEDLEAQILSYTGSDTVLDIPEYIGEYKITSVNYAVVQEKSNKKLHVEQIRIPKTVVDIDEAIHEPFSLCVDCTAFFVDDENPSYCSESGILYSKDGTKLLRVPCAYPGQKLTIKTGVKVIGKGALSDCAFTDIVFAETLETIEDKFMEHSQVEELYFPDSLVSISTNAFYGNYKTKYIHFGAKTQLSNAFRQVQNIEAYSVSGENPYFSVQDGVLFNKNKTRLIAYPPAKKAETYVIPDGVLSIGKNAFFGSDIKTLFTNQVQSVETGVFSIESIDNFDSVVFGEDLQSIAIDSGLFGIRSWTFLSKDFLITSLAYPSQKKTVYGYYGSNAYQTFYLNEKNKAYFDFVLLDEEPEQGFRYTALTNDTVRIDAFVGFETSLEIPAYIDGKKVVEIGAYAFKDNTSITALTLPQTLEKMDSHALEDLTKVTTLTIPASVTAIDSYALSGMSALTKLYVNSFCCTIGEGAFPDVRVFACSGSTAESYARAQGLSFVSVGHQFVSEEIENEKLRKTCTVCGYSEVVNNPNAQHTYVPRVIAPTCTEQGYTIYTCSVCGDSYQSEYKAALGHDTFEIKATSPSCQVEGKTAGIQCARCQLVLKEQEPIAKLPHEYDGGKITATPTCTREGVKTYTCRNCDAYYTEKVERTAHRYIETVVAASCTAEGYTTFTCADCGDTYESDRTPVIAHTPQVIPAIAATCTREGSTQGSKCAACGVILEPTQTLPKLPHRYDSGTLSVKPTCQREGIKTFKCVNCSDYYTQSVAKIDHLYVSVVKKKASFSQNGVVNEECSMCHALRKSVVVKALKSLKLSQTVFNYTGKKLAAPKVSVKDSSGKTIAAKNYTLSYISRANAKAVSSISAIGQYKVKVQFKNMYSGTKYLYFTVKPRSVKVYAPTAAKKAITAKWKKDTSATGYQVVIATNKAFTAGKKVVNITKNTVTSKNIAGLKSGKVYYVRIRAFKKITVDGKKLNIYSSYSPIKSVKCK